MKISVIGCGYLGAVHAACMASLGHDVVGIDVVPDKVAALNSGFASIYEPGLDELLQAGLKAGNLRFTTDFSEASDAVAHFIGVGTPQKPGETGADLSYLHGAVDSLKPYLAEGSVIVGKSTVPVGTAQAIADDAELKERGAVLAWNPEFLREGHAIQDTIAPDRLVYGLPEDPETAAHARKILDEVYASVIEAGTPLIVTDYPTSELVKVSANAFLAMKISFINAVAQMAEVAGANITELADAIGHDDRIGRKFLNAGVGFGGGCLPKDIRAFKSRAQELGIDYVYDLMTTVDQINLAQREGIVAKVQKLFPEPAGISVAILGLAFKPESDDLRDSPALDIAIRLHELGYRVTATDPKAIEKAREINPSVRYVESMDEAMAGANLVILLTEWKQYTQAPVPAAPSADSTIIDGRNSLSRQEWEANGWKYLGVGR